MKINHEETKSTKKELKIIFVLFVSSWLISEKSFRLQLAMTRNNKNGRAMYRYIKYQLAHPRSHCQSSRPDARNCNERE